jgi:hypothetical protein
MKILEMISRLKVASFSRDAVAPHETKQDDGNKQNPQDENAHCISGFWIWYGCGCGENGLHRGFCHNERLGGGRGCPDGGENQDIPHQEGDSQENKEDDDSLLGDVGSSHAPISITWDADCFGIMEQQPKLLPGDK